MIFIVGNSNQVEPASVKGSGVFFWSPSPSTTRRNVAAARKRLPPHASCRSFASRDLQVVFHHHLDQLPEVTSRRPAQRSPGLARVTLERMHLRGPVELGPRD